MLENFARSRQVAFVVVFPFIAICICVTTAYLGFGTNLFQGLLRSIFDGQVQSYSRKWRHGQKGLPAVGRRMEGTNARAGEESVTTMKTLAFLFRGPTYSASHKPDSGYGQFGTYLVDFRRHVNNVKPVLNGLRLHFIVRVYLATYPTDQAVMSQVVSMINASDVFVSPRENATQFGMVGLALQKLQRKGLDWLIIARLDLIYGTAMYKLMQGVSHHDLNERCVYNLGLLSDVWMMFHESLLDWFIVWWTASFEDDPLDLRKKKGERFFNDDQRAKWRQGKGALRKFIETHGFPKHKALTHGVILKTARPNSLYVIARGWNGHRLNLGAYGMCDAPKRGVSFAFFKENPSGQNLCCKASCRNGW